MVQLKQIHLVCWVLSDLSVGQENLPMDPTVLQEIPPEKGSRHFRKVAMHLTSELTRYARHGSDHIGHPGECDKDPKIVLELFRDAMNTVRIFPKDNSYLEYAKAVHICGQHSMMMDLPLRCPLLFTSGEERLEAEYRAAFCSWVLDPADYFQLDPLEVTMGEIVEGSRSFLLDTPGPKLVRGFDVKFKGESVAECKGHGFEKWMRLFGQALLSETKSGWFQQVDGLSLPVVALGERPHTDFESYKEIGVYIGLAYRAHLKVPFTFPLEYYKILVGEETKDGLGHAELGEVALNVGYLREGFSKIVPMEWIKGRITAEDLRDALTGEIFTSIDDLKRHTRYGDSMPPDSPFVEKFWDYLRGMGEAQHRKFLLLAIGREEAPVGGFVYLDPPFTIDGFERKLDRHLDEMPTFSPCSHTMKLPPYKSKHTLYDQLVAAIGPITGSSVPAE